MKAMLWRQHIIPHLKLASKLKEMQIKTVSTHIPNLLLSAVVHCGNGKQVIFNLHVKTGLARK